MSELRCHYCGAGCRVDGEADIYVHCPECGADGPICDTPEAAVAAHATVMPRPRWTSEPPKTPGWYWSRYRHGPGDRIDVQPIQVSQDDIDAGGIEGFGLVDVIPWGDYLGFAGPTPEPADAAEGGGE